MIEHLSNCHGEWNAIIALIGGIPFIGAWLRFHMLKLRRKRVTIE